MKAMWFRCLMYCIFALAAFFIGSLFGQYVPLEIKEIISQDALSNILTILASSMLAVTTFSLSIMVQAFSAAATTATPRANKLIMEDSAAQNALGTFIGAFLFSIVGIIGVNANFYDKDIVVVLFLFTVIMIFVIVVMLLRWIDQLSKLGRVTETIKLVDKALGHAITKRSKSPFLYAKPLEYDKETLQEIAHPVTCSEVGYVQYIDVGVLDNIACENELLIYVAVNPGKFLDGTETVVYTDNPCDEATVEKIVDAILVGGNRTFEQDPRYGFVVLSEIALRALSPAVNDPGTAIDIIGSYIRGITLWVEKNALNDETCKEDHTADSIKYPHVYVTNIDEQDMFDDMYAGLIAVASEHITVAIRLKKSLLTFSRFDSTVIQSAARFWLTQLEQRCETLLSENEYQRLMSFG